VTDAPNGVIRVGVAGLGMAGGAILSSLKPLPGVEIVAAADPRKAARSSFETQFDAASYDSMSALCDDDGVDAIWIATPTQFHAQHVQQAAERGKHIVVEKPFAVTLDECQKMIDAADRYKVTLIAGGARSFDPAFVAMREVITSGRLGRLGALNTWSFTGWIVRPREPYEVDVSQGGGTVYNQAPHPIDVLRLLGGGMVRSIRGTTAEWMAERPCPGYFTAFMEFEDGVPATLSYNGHGYIQGWELLPWGETPGRKNSSEAGYEYRRLLRSNQADEIEARETLRFGGPAGPFGFSGDGNWTPSDAGLVVASCERGEIRQSATGLYIYDDNGRHDEPLPEGASLRLNELTELRDAINGLAPPLHDGRWGMATMEVVLAMMESATTRQERTLMHQKPVTSAPL
jgi:phthalate 4,5-cis-dihydrodiol dehydrogenase